MLKWSTLLIVMVISGSVAQAAPLQLRSDAKTINKKARSIEVEYSRDMRANSASQAVENMPHQGAIVIEEAAPITAPAPVTTTAPVMAEIPGATNTYFTDGAGSSSFSYPTNLQMRNDRRAGAGVSVGGVLGVIGFNMELNLEDADGVVAGFGTGPGYNSFQVAWKHSFEGAFITPYTTAGYSRWYNSRGRSDDYRDSSILDRVLTDTEKSEGRFGTDFVNVSLGVQYNQLTGDFAGVSFYGELNAMYEVKRSILLPNGGVGALYYF